jgi:transposase-like protein
MASKVLDRERMQALIADLLAEQVEEGDLLIDDIEDAMVELGDAVAQEYARQQLARQMAQPPDSPLCPHCRHPGEQAGQRNREILTRRGSVPIREAKYRCPKCRRHFFPSDRAAGT